MKPWATNLYSRAQGSGQVLGAKLAVQILRQKLLPLVRWETPYLAYVQVREYTPR